MRGISALAVLALVVFAAPAEAVVNRTLDGGGNNLLHPTWGQAGTQYLRVAPPNYADGVAKPVAGPPTRRVSNRVFNDIGQNLFSEGSISQWGWLWGQFMDHDFGLRDETPAENAPIAFNANDPLEDFRNDFGAIDFHRTPAAPGTGSGGTPRQQINTISSFIDGSGVFGVTASRLDWLREGPVDGDPANNKATLLLRNGYLPRRDARGNAATAPPMDLFAGQVATPGRAVVAGDVRANENMALTATHTLFAREHNRIVNQLRSQPLLSEEDRFQIARRVIYAEEEFITYNEFLPNLGVDVAPYHGYDPTVDSSLGNEFAATGYRAHSMIHGEFEPTFPAGTFSAAQLDGFRRAGITVEEDGGVVTLVIPLVVAFGNPDLLESVGIKGFIQGLGNESQYKNDDQIDNSLRSVLFQVPKPGIPDPSVCGSPVINPDCFVGVQDLGAIDIERGRDHGIPLYNDLRRAYGLPPKASFKDVTGESTEQLPAGLTIDDPRILDFVALQDAEGNPLPPDTQVAITGIRRTTTAARLKALYGTPDKLDGFVGMVAERHVPGTEFGELQRAIWRKQFEAARDGDRFFYMNDPQLTLIKTLYGIDFHHTLAEVIRMNTGATVADNVFKVPA